MMHLKCLITACLLGVALIVHQISCDKLEPNNAANVTPAPKAIPLNAPTEAPKHPAPASPNFAPALKTEPGATHAPIKSLVATSVAPAANNPVPVAATAKTTARPAATNALKPTEGPATASAAPVVAPTAHSATSSSPIAQKLTNYFEPICGHLNNLLPEHTFKVQSQLKQFIERTAGKMSVCFLQHYLADPNLVPIGKAQLEAICSSRTLAPGNENSFQSFINCAEKNWDNNLDTELERIIRLRLNCFFNHAHSKNNAIISLVHDNDEIALIQDVVGQVLYDNKSSPIEKSHIKMIDVGPAAAPSAANPAPAINNPTPAAKKILNDPNTLLVLVDDAGKASPPPELANAAHMTPTTSQAPAHPATDGSFMTTFKPLATTSVPSTNTVINIQPAATTAHPTESTLGEKILHAASTAAPPTPPPSPPVALPLTTLAPTTSVTVTASLGTHKPTVVPSAGSAAPTVAAAAAGAKVPEVKVVVNPSTATPATKVPAVATTSKPSSTNVTVVVHATTAKPAAAASVEIEIKSNATTTKSPAPTKIASTTLAAKTTSKPTTGPPTILAPSTTKPPATAAKPITTSAAPKSKHDEEKEKLKRDQDEKVAKNAIKALEKQRAEHVSDARMHQIEHERQMALDPIGHTIKHQRYERLKQMRSSTKRPATSSTAVPESKKP